MRTVFCAALLLVLGCSQPGPVESPAPSGRFQLRSRMAVDVSTQLWWTRDFEETRAFDDARSFCDGLVLNDLDDWRVPSGKELATLLNWRTETEAGKEDRVFPTKAAPRAWTSTLMGGQQLVVDFQARMVRGEDAAEGVYCVRGPQPP